MMTSYLLLITFLSNGIHALQQQWKKCVNHEGNQVKKMNPIPCDYHGQPMNFSINLHIHLSINLSLSMSIYQSYSVFFY